ncbi:MAG: SMC-Scp complex subunit ScpB [Bacilli bacterium]|nr:SMC-Scp complex subunit ScpB [Bacilli bacterium]
MDLQGVLEGLLFVVGDEGLTLNQICDSLSIDEEKAKELLLNLKSSYEDNSRGIRISFLGNAFKLTTKSEHKEFYQKLLLNEETNTLSDAAMETVAIIAYHQPITRVEIDNLRGVATSHIIRKLLAKGLIKEVGKSTMPGRPNLYGTTHEFLDYFGISSLNELPDLPKDEETTDDTELYQSIYKENIEN